MTKASQKVTRNNSRVRSRKSSRNTLLWIAGIGAAVVVTTALAFIVLAPPAVPTLDGVVKYDNLSRTHSEAPQTYPQTPPVGGVHSSVWQNCGIYDQPVRNENAVHSLEHGAVWITYQPDLPAAMIEHIRSLARGHDHVLVTPYPNLPKPVVASAWGLQLPLDDVADPRLSLFISRYESGPQTPEPGAVCSGGIGTPLS
jgi:hypothetical protein